MGQPQETDRGHILTLKGTPGGRALGGSQTCLGCWGIRLYQEAAVAGELSSLGLESRKAASQERGGLELGLAGAAALVHIMSGQSAAVFSRRSCSPQGGNAQASSYFHKPSVNSLLRVQWRTDTRGVRPHELKPTETAGYRDRWTGNLDITDLKITVLTMFKEIKARLRILAENWKLRRNQMKILKLENVTIGVKFSKDGWNRHGWRRNLKAQKTAQKKIPSRNPGDIKKKKGEISR